MYSDIYRGEDIIQKGAIQHRDIPIDSKTTPYHSAVKLIAYFPLLDKGTNEMIIQGRVSHPLTKINVYGKKPSIDKKDTFVRTTLLTMFTADKTGQFDIRYSMNKLGPTEVIGDIEFIKPDYTTMKDEQASANTTLKVEPILNYLEGYAYDKAGKPIPNATVGVYLNLSNKPAYETKADANGFFRISSEYLPSMSYGVRYTGAGGTNSLTTSQFISQNTKYLETQGSNLFVFKDKKGKTFTQGEREKFAADETELNKTTPQGENQAMVQSKKATSDVLPIVIILVFLGLGAIVAIVYFMKKKS
ncbi:carboxypeptidase regulatory-like domain-containing protein [Candidatus Roizmanbacteria bacterium]|nr:carboxypeptidase regulatory-like domain-containing protein [Candidatus Roizmanbacteria bacterium]